MSLITCADTSPLSIFYTIVKSCLSGFDKSMSDLLFCALYMLGRCVQNNKVLVTHNENYFFHSDFIEHTEKP